MKKIIAHYISISGNSYEGISLDKSVINIVAHELSVGRKISAIKELRKATGMGLKDSKTIMDRFEPTDHGAKKFIIAFS
jgi:ribosomal protein L7/L12